MFLHKALFRALANKFISPQTNQFHLRFSSAYLEKPFYYRCLSAFAASLLLISSQSALAVNVGDTAPSCTLLPFGESQASNLSQYKGKVLYVDFWASWCASCAQSFGFLNEIHDQFKDRGLQIVGINVDENKDDAIAFLEKHIANFAIAEDTGKQCIKDFDVQAMPSSFVIDRKGTVHYIHVGFRAGETQELRTLLEKLLNDKAASS